MDLFIGKDLFTKMNNFMKNKKCTLKGVFFYDIKTIKNTHNSWFKKSDINKG